MQETKHEMAVVIMSCDAFSDVWAPFFALFKRFWPECPYKVYLISENKEAKNFACNTILAGMGKNWSDRLIYGLQQIEEKYILFLQEDYFLNKPVNASIISEIIALCEKHSLVNVRLYPAITSELKQTNFTLGKIDKEKEKYIVCTQASIWRREFLLRLVIPNESVWDFERNATKRSMDMVEDFYSVFPTTAHNKLDQGNYPITYLFLTSITRGKWTLKTVRFCRDNGINQNLKLRRANSRLDEYYMGSAPLWMRHIIDFVNCRTKKYFGVDLRTYPLK